MKRKAKGKKGKPKNNVPLTEINRYDEDKSSKPIGGLQSVKYMLKRYITSLQDLDRLKSQIESKTLTLDGQEVNVTKLGKKKILKKIAMISQNVERDLGATSDMEQVLLRKLRVPISKLIVKYGDPEGVVQTRGVKSKKVKDEQLLDEVDMEDEEESEDIGGEISMDTEVVETDHLEEKVEIVSETKRSGKKGKQNMNKKGRQPGKNVGMKKAGDKSGSKKKMKNKKRSGNKI